MFYPQMCFQMCFFFAFQTISISSIDPGVKPQTPSILGQWTILERFCSVNKMASIKVTNTPREFSNLWQQLRSAGPQKNVGTTFELSASMTISTLIHRIPFAVLMDTIIKRDEIMSKNKPITPQRWGDRGNFKKILSHIFIDNLYLFDFLIPLNFKFAFSKVNSQWTCYDLSRSPKLSMCVFLCVFLLLENYLYYGSQQVV